MSLAVLVFSLIVGFFHLQGDAGRPGDAEMLADEPEVPTSYMQAPGEAQPSLTAVPRQHLAAGKARGASGARAVQRAGGANPDSARAAMLELADGQDLSQRVADLIAADPRSASLVLTRALTRIDGDTTLGEIATLSAAATRAAPEQASAIAGAATRTLKHRGNPALAAAVATIISLVPEQSRDIGLVVGAILGDDIAALGMVAQTVAIATGEATFNSLSEASGVPVAALMKASAGFGINVPFDLPAYAAQMAPSPTRVADGVDSAADTGGEM